MTLPLLWLAAAFLLFMAGAMMRERPPVIPPGLYLTDAPSAHHIVEELFGMVWAMFGGVYAVLEGVDRIRYRRWLGYIHLTLACTGSFLAFAPNLISGQRYFDPFSFRSAYDAVSAFGYTMTLASLAFLIVVLGDAIGLSVASRRKR